MLGIRNLKVDFIYQKDNHEPCRNFPTLWKHIMTQESNYGMTNNCKFCSKHREMNQNYCRNCGHELAKGHTKYAPVSYAYLASEIYCGYCGKLREVCNNIH